MAIQFIIMAFSFFRKTMRGEKATAGTTFSSMSKGTYARLVARFLQMLFAIVVIGLYAQDLRKAKSKGAGYDSKWMYATIVGTITCAWAFLCCFVKSWYWFTGDLVSFILYLVAFGIFGKMYIHEDPEGNKGIVRMKNAVWILLVNLLLWFFTTCYGAVIFWKNRKALTPHTGRGQMHV